MKRLASVLAIGAALLLQSACTNPAHTEVPIERRLNGGSMGSGGRTGEGDPEVSATSTDGALVGTCYEELNGGSMGSGGRDIVPCPTPAT
jgi:hypothetical protein